MSLLERYEAKLIVHTVPGLVNPADEPSRRKPIDAAKTAQWSALYRSDFYMPRFQHDDAYKGTARHRHAEPEEEEVEVISQMDQLLSFGEGEEDPADYPISES
jgi:hypothetical protein